MRCRLSALIVMLALGAADIAQGDWRTYAVANRIGAPAGWQRGNRRTSYARYTGWRNYGAVNRVSPDGVWQRGYGRMGYGWYSAYGDYVGSDYGTIGFGNRNRASGFNFNRTDNYGFIDPRDIGDRPR